MNKMVIVVFLLFFSRMAIGEVECSDRPECWPVGSAMRTKLNANQRLSDADKKLNVTYQRILKRRLSESDETDSNPKSLFISAQRQWIKYRDANCASIGEDLGGARIWKSAYTRRCEAEMTEARVRELESVYEEDQ